MRHIKIGMFFNRDSRFDFLFCFVIFACVLLYLHIGFLELTEFARDSQWVLSLVNTFKLKLMVTLISIIYSINNTYNMYIIVLDIALRVLICYLFDKHCILLLLTMSQLKYWLCIIINLEFLIIISFSNYRDFEY